MPIRRRGTILKDMLGEVAAPMGNTTRGDWAE